MIVYNSFAKSTIVYDLLAYGSAVKSILVKIVRAQKRILRATFFRKKLESLKGNLSENKILTLFELYTVEVLKELFKQLRYEKSVQYIQEKSHYKNEGIITGSKTKKLLQPKFCGPNLKKKSMGNDL